MKICFFHLKADAVFRSVSEAPIGGTLVQLHTIATELAKDPSFSVSFITGDYGQKDEQVHDGVVVYTSAVLKRGVWYYAIAPWKIWKAFRRVDADVYITSSAGIETGFLALLCKLYRKKMVYRTAHEWDCNGEYVRTHGLAGRSFLYGLSHANCIVTQSTQHQDLLRTTHGLDSIVIPNAFRINNEPIEKKDYILWVARCEPWKRPDLYIRLAQKFQNLSFVMICPMQKYQESYFESIRKEAKDIPNIQWIDGVPFDQIQKYFNEARIFIGTSEYEGFPNTFLQACIGHTPIVSYVVNPDMFITTNATGYVALGSEDALESSLRQLLDDHTDWAEKSRNAFSYVSRTHALTSILPEWVDTISRL